MANSDLALRLAMGVGRATPPAVGARLANTTADAIASLRSAAITRALRVNQWVVSGGTLSGGDLDERVRENLRRIARCLYDLYHLAEDPEAMLAEVVISEEVQAWLDRSNSEPVVFAALHLSNFDLAGRVLGLGGLKAQVLSVPVPTDAYQVQNDLRRAVGLDITPISMASLRTAAERLAAGGSVLTGLDRPLPQAKHAVRFFGRPALLPDVHVRLAERSGAPLVMIWVHASGDGYAVEVREVPLEPASDAETTVANTERVLAVAETVIAERPTEWAMPHVVWPEAAAELEALTPGRG